MNKEEIIRLFNKADLLTVDDEVVSFEWAIDNDVIAINYEPTNELFHGFPNDEGGTFRIIFENIKNIKIEFNSLIIDDGLEETRITFYKVMDIC